MLDIVRRTAEIFDLRLGRAPRGAEVLPAPLRRAPRRSRDDAALETALERWGAWAELRELVDEQAGRAPDPTARVALLRRSAKLDEEKLDDANRAVGTLREALEVDPTDRKAARRAGALLSQAGRWSDLADHLNSSLDREPLGADKDAATLRLAEILANRIGDTTSAVDRYAEILSRPAAAARRRGRGQRPRGAGQRRRPALPRGDHPRAGLPARRRSQQAGRRARRAARIGRRSGRAGARPRRDGRDPPAPRPPRPGVRLPQPRLAGRRGVDWRPWRRWRRSASAPSSTRRWSWRSRRARSRRSIPICRRGSGPPRPSCWSRRSAAPPRPSRPGARRWPPSPTIGTSSWRWSDCWPAPAAPASWWRSWSATWRSPSTATSAR